MGGVNNFNTQNILSPPLLLIQFIYLSYIVYFIILRAVVRTEFVRQQNFSSNFGLWHTFTPCFVPRLNGRGGSTSKIETCRRIWTFEREWSLKICLFQIRLKLSQKKVFRKVLLVFVYNLGNLTIPNCIWTGKPYNTII